MQINFKDVLGVDCSGLEYIEMEFNEGYVGVSLDDIDQVINTLRPKVFMMNSKDYFVLDVEVACSLNRSYEDNWKDVTED